MSIMEGELEVEKGRVGYQGTEQCSLSSVSLCRPVQADSGWRAVCYGAPTSERGTRIEGE